MTNDVPLTEAAIRAWWNNLTEGARIARGDHGQDVRRRSLLRTLLDALDREREANRELREAVLADAFPVPHHEFDYEGLNTCEGKYTESECDCGAREANARLRALLHPGDASEGKEG